MSPWQVLRASRATYRVYRGLGGSVHYDSPPVAAAEAEAPDGSRSSSISLSTERVTMQELNSRLASYLQQVQDMEEANQRLEYEIQKELDRKCPRELRELDEHLRTVSLLQDQISECLSAQAQVKLQLLNAELTVVDLNLRCEKERERRGDLEVEINNLKLLDEELHVHTLPELQSVVNDQTQELMEMQIQHKQDMQGLLTQMSGGITVEMEPAESSNLIQQLDDLRETNETLMDKNRNECWFNTQVSMVRSPEVTFDPPPESEVVHAELEELRGRAECLEEELTQLQALNMELEASGLEQNEYFVEELGFLEQTADGLCRDLDSVLQAIAQQDADFESLLDVKTRLEAEIQAYMRLLDGLSPLGVLGLHPNVTSFCPSAFSRNSTVNQTVNVQGESLWMMEVQTVPRGHIDTFRQTPVVTPLSDTMTTVQSIRAHSKHPENSPVTSINTLNLTDSFHKSENQITGAFPERTGRESMTVSAMINRQSNPVEDLQNSSIVCTQISQVLDKEAVTASKAETNTAPRIITLVSDSQSVSSAAVQATPEIFTSKQNTTEAGLQANETGTNIQTEITKTILCAEPEVKQETHFVTTITDTSKPTVAEVKEETETLISAQINCTEDSIQAKNQEPAQVVSLSLETPKDAVRNAGEEVTVSIVSGSHVLTSEEAQTKVSTDLTLMNDKDTEKQEKKVKEVPKVKVTSRFLRADQSLTSSDSSSTKQNKVMEDANTKSSIVTDSSGISDSKITSQTEITKTILCAEPEVKQETYFVTTITDTSKPTAPEVKEETETLISAQINCTEDSIQAKNQEPAQVVSLSLETPAEPVVDAGEDIAVSIVSGSHVPGSVEAQTKVSTDLTLMDHKDTEKQEKRVKEVPKVKVTSRFLRADQSLTSSDSSSTKQNKVMEDANTKSSIVTDSSGIYDSKITSQIEITKTILCAEPEVKQETHFVTTITDTSKPTVAEVKEETETVISAQINCTENSIQAKNQEPAQVVSLSLETPAEPVVDAGEDIAVSIVSGSHLHGSVEAETKVSTDLTLMDHKDTEKQDKKVKEVPKVKVTSRFLRADQSLTSTDSSNTKQNKVMEDANTKSSIVTAASVIPDSKDNIQRKTAQGLITLVSDTQSVSSAAAQATPEIFTSKQNTTEAGLQANETGTNIQTEITKTVLCAEPEVKQETHFVTTITDTSKPTVAEVKEETETLISAQINCTEDSIQAKNQEPAQVVSLSLETPAEPVVDAGEDIAVSIVSGSHLHGSVEAETKVSTDLTLMDHKDTEKQDKKVKEVPKVKVTSRFLRADQSLTSTDSSNTKQNKVMEDANTKSSIVTAASVIPDSKDNIQRKTAQGLITLVSDTQSVSSAAAQATPEIFTSKQNTTEAGLQANETGTNIQTEITKTILCAEPEVKQETHFVTTITDTSNPTVAEVKEETETLISAQINCTEDSIQAKNQEPAQVVSLSLETPAEPVVDAGEDIAVSIVSGSHLHGSVEAQTKVSTDLTLMDHKDTEKQEKRVKEVPKVKVTSRFLRADQSLTSSDSSSTKQNKVMEDANTKSSIVTDSSGIYNSKITSQTEITKTILCAEPEVKQETHFVTTITDTSKPTVAEVKEETKTVISAQINCTENSIQAKNQEPAQVVSLSLETPAEPVVDAGEDIAVSIVSGSHLHGSVEAETKVSTDLTLMDHKDTEKQDKKVKEVPKVKVTSRFLRADQSLTSTDSSNTKQNKVMEDANTKSSIVTAASVIPDSKDNIQRKTAQGLITLVSDTQSVSSAAVQATPEIFTSKQNTTEAGLQANETGTNIQTEITKTILCAEPEVKQETHFVTTITDTSKPTVAEVKEETETLISAQINCTEDSIQAKNQEPAQVVSLSLETPAEPVVDAGEDIAVSIVSGSHVPGSVEAQTKVSTDLTLMDHKDTEKQEKRVKEVPKVKVTSRFLRADQSLTSSDSSSTKQNKVMEDANTKSSIVTDSSSISDSKITSQTEITKTILCAEPEVKQETHFVTTITDTSKPTVAEVKEETKTVISAQINCTEDSIQAKNQEPAQVVSLSLETPAEPVVDAGEDIAVSIVSGSHLHGSVEAETKVSTDLTLMDHKDTEKQDKKVKEVPKVKVTSRFLRADQSLTSTDSSNTKQNKVMEDANTKSSIVTAASVIPDSKDNIQRKTAQGLITLVSDTQSVSSAAVQATPEIFTSKQNTTEAGLQANETGTNIQTEITKTILCAEPEVKQETHFVTTITDTSKPTVAEVKEETETLISAQINCTEDSIQAKNQEPAQVVSLSLETPKEAVRNAGEDIAVSIVSGSHVPGSVEAQTKVSTDLTLMNESIRLDQSSALSDASNSEQNKVIEDADTGSGIATASSGRPDSTDSSESKTGSTESFKKVEVEVNKGKVDSVFQNTTEAIVDHTELDNKVHLAGQVGCLSPVQTEVLTCMKDQLFRPVDLEKHVRSPDSLLTPSDPAMFLSPNDSDTCLSPVKAMVSPNGEEEDERVCLTEASRCTGGIADNKDVQKPGRSIGQMPVFEDQRQISSVDSEIRGKKRLFVKSASFGSVRANEETSFSGVISKSGGMVNSGMASELTGRFSGKAANSSGIVSSNADAGVQGRIRHDSGEWIVYGGNLGRKCSLDGSPSLPRNGKEEGPTVAINPATNPQDTGRFSSRGGGDWMVYSGSLGHKSTFARTRSEESTSASVVPATSLPEMRSSITGSGSLLNTGSTGTLPTALDLETSSPGTRKFGSRGSGEWRVYGGGTGRMSSWAGSSSLHNADKEETPQLPTSPPGSQRAGRFGSAGSGEWRVYGGSTGRLSGASSADRVSVSANGDKRISSPSPRPRLSRASSGSMLSSGSVNRRSSSVGSGGKLNSSGSGGRLSNSSGSYRDSTSGKYTSTGNSEWKPVYSSANARKSMGSTGRSGGGGMSVSMSSSGWLTSSASGGNHIGSSGSGSSITGGSDRISGQAGGRISSSSGSGRTNTTGGRVISSSQRPIRSTGSGAGSIKERISVCKMAALSISAAGREKSQDRQRQAQRSQQQQKSEATSPLLQQWLSGGVRVKSGDPDGPDDNMRL